MRPSAPVSPLIATPARAKRIPAIAASRTSPCSVRRSERWPESEARGDQRKPALEAEDRRRPRSSEWLPLKCGTVTTSRARPAPPRKSAEPLAALDRDRRRGCCAITARVTAPPARTACTREIGAIERAATWTSQATAAESPACREPARGGEAAARSRSGLRMLRSARRVAAAVLEQRREVGHQRRRRPPGRSLSPSNVPQTSYRRAGSRSLARLPVVGGGVGRREALARLGDRRDRGVTGLGDHAVGVVGCAADLELDQSGAAELGADCRRGLSRAPTPALLLGRALTPADQAELALARACPGLGEGGLLAVDPARRTAAAVAGPFLRCRRGRLMRAPCFLAPRVGAAGELPF